MDIKVLKHKFIVCKILDVSRINMSDEFLFIGKTDEELSLVCTTEFAPEGILEREDGWRGFRIEGVLDFSLVGILSQISGLLAGNDIGIFAVSTYNTDYILTKEENFDRALQVLKEDGYHIVD
ncbi:MAG: amino acid-binding protein [Anaerocolumna sp.]|nr:amino acid-binding protein [Anaerocolumna sp.]